MGTEKIRPSFFFFNWSFKKKKMGASWAHYFGKKIFQVQDCVARYSSKNQENVNKKNWFSPLKKKNGHSKKDKNHGRPMGTPPIQ